MKLPFATKYNGIWYNAGEEIPVEKTEVEQPIEEKVEETETPDKDEPVVLKRKTTKKK